MKSIGAIWMKDKCGDCSAGFAAYRIFKDNHNHIFYAFLSKYDDIFYKCLNRSNFEDDTKNIVNYFVKFQYCPHCGHEIGEKNDMS